MERERRRVRITGFFLGVLTIVVLFWALETGTIQVSFVRFWQEVFRTHPSEVVATVRDLRLPRILIAFLSGAGLAISAMSFQLVSRNSLAEPGFLGVGAAAEFGYLLTVVLLPQLFPLRYGFSFLVAAVVMALLLLSQRRQKSAAYGGRFLLTGIALQAILGGFNTLITTMSTSSGQAGNAPSIGLRNWVDVRYLAFWILLGLCIFWCFARWWDVLALPESTVQTLGVPVRLLTMVAVCCAVLLTTVTVTQIGVVTFVGLLAAQITKRFLKTHYRVLIPFAALVGGNLMVVADTIGRSWFLPLEVSANQIFLIVGGVLLLVLLLKGDESDV